jgi:hypothetical protein
LTTTKSKRKNAGEGSALDNEAFAIERTKSDAHGYIIKGRTTFLNKKINRAIRVNKS